ncbi:MAG: hypothetical protein IKQ35_03015 [Bacilli bacterium]|nr:hypothetical protein [Bacilli bacterium]
MKNNKPKLLIIIIGVVFIIIGIILHFLVFKDKSVYYKITYDDNSAPGSQSIIEVYNDRIDISTTHYCSAKNCSPTKENKTLKYNKEIMDKLIKYLKNNYKKNDIKVNREDLMNDGINPIEYLMLGEKWLELSLEDYEYLIEYHENNTYGYYIYFKDDNSIVVKKAKINDKYDIVNIDTYNLDFKKEKIKLLYKYVENESKTNKTKYIIKSSILLKNETNIFKSIVEKDEKYLTEEEELVYIISYSGVNCPTPILYLYNDNTYEYYYTFATGYQKPTPKIGNYNYDINKIIKNIDKYKEDPSGIYNINELNGKTYKTYSTNAELKEFLNSIDVKLEECTEQQN